MKILVTGANGQLGYDVVRELQKRGHDTIGVDIGEMDITDEESVRSVLTSAAPEAVIHCAAWTAVDAAEDNAEKVYAVNALGTRYIAQACRRLNAKMMYISTDYVFDGQGHIPYREDMLTAPQSVYGRTKLAGEEKVVRNCPGAMVIRTAWLYSSYGKNFVKTMLRLAKERSEIGVVADQIGTPTYAHDLARAICAIAERGIVPGIYHFTNEGVCSWYDFTKTIFRLEGIDADDCRVRPLRTDEYPSAAARPHYSVLDKSKIKQTYGLDIRWWEDALKSCLKKL